MTEREKAEAGYLYRPSDDMVEHRFKIQDMCVEYNKLLPSQLEEREAFLKKMLGKVGKGANILPPFRCDYGYRIEIGENFFANYNFIVLDGNYVRIGDNVWIAPKVGIYAAGHPLDRDERVAGLEYAFPVTIGDNVWIGGGVNIVGGVTIGKDSVIGAGSVVTRDIPEGVVAVGNPCRVVRKITPEDREKYIHID